jgi:hypothetical protein
MAIFMTICFYINYCLAFKEGIIEGKGNMG